MVIVMENTTFGSVIGSHDAPTINALADGCALATDYHGIQFPSLPNYIQMTSGTAPPSIAGDGRRGSDCTPAADCQSTDPSIFCQLEAAGLSWKSYAESMPSNCFLQDAGRVRTAAQSGRLLRQRSRRLREVRRADGHDRDRARWHPTCAAARCRPTASSPRTSATTGTTPAAASRPGGRGGSIHGGVDAQDRIASPDYQSGKPDRDPDRRHLLQRRSEQPSGHDRGQPVVRPHTRARPPTSTTTRCCG